MAVVTIAGGQGSGLTALVSDDGRLLSDVGVVEGVETVTEVLTIVNPVATRPAASSAATSTPTAGFSASSQIVDPREGRTWLEIQNLGDADVHIALGDDDATTANRRVGPGEVFSLPGGVGFDGAVQAIAVGEDCDLAVHELFT